MTAIADRAPITRLNWPRISALSGSMSLHLCGLALLLAPPIATQIIKHFEPDAPVIVRVLSPPPEVVQPEPPLPILLHHETRPRVPPPHVEAVEPASPPVTAAPSDTFVAAQEAAKTIAPAATQDVAPTALAYGTRTRVTYPRESQLLGEHGTVILRVLVASDGRPQIVEIETSSGSPRLDQAARNAVKHWTFRAGTRDGVARSAWARVPIAFDFSTL